MRALTRRLRVVWGLVCLVVLVGVCVRTPRVASVLWPHARVCAVRGGLKVVAKMQDRPFLII